MRPKYLLRMGGVFFALLAALSLACGGSSSSAPAPAAPQTITLLSIPGVTVPATGATPVTAVGENAQYTGTISWAPPLTDGKFAPAQAYTATITLTARSGWTLNGLAANQFTVAGADSVTHNANGGVVTAQFPATAPQTITLLDIPGITVPAIGATPVTAVSNNDQYSGTVIWSPSHSPFQGNQFYTATITLDAKVGWTFSGIAADSFRVAGASSVTHLADSRVVTAVFPKTAAPRVLSISYIGTGAMPFYYSSDSAPSAVSFLIQDGANPVANQNLTLHFTGTGGFNIPPTTASTDANGKFTLSLQGQTEGIATMTAIYADAVGTVSLIVNGAKSAKGKWITGTGITECFNEDGALTVCNSSNPFHAKQDGMLGQTLSYSEVPKGDGTYYARTECVKDNNTGLIWEGKPIGTGTVRDASATFTYYLHTALAYPIAINDSNFCGMNDWRLPTPEELQSLVNYNNQSASIDNAWFPNTSAGNYWSSVRYAANNDYIWYVEFLYGGLKVDSNYSKNYVRLVSGALTESANRYSYSSDGSEVRDARTGLIWRRYAEGMVWSNNTCEGVAATYNHQQALVYAHGVDGWRLPTVKELASIVEKSRHSPAINPSVFPATPSGAAHWASSRYSADAAWQVHFLLGYVQSGNRSQTCHIRLVRTEETP